MAVMVTTSDMMWPVDAGAWLRDLRIRHRLSQAALAARAGTSQQALSKIENGSVSPSMETLSKLAAAVGEELLLDSRPREIPFDSDQLAAAINSPMPERLERALSWNRFAGEIAVAGARARDRVGRGMRRRSPSESDVQDVRSTA
jgi:transcriptional regulator with XRE-family HTH domain